MDSIALQPPQESDFDEEAPPASGIRSIAPPFGANGLSARASDAELALAAEAGNTTAQRAIVGRYARMVRAKVRTCVGSEGLEDLVQETFLRFFERLPDLRDPSALRSFLLGIAFRVAITELRRRKASRVRLTDDGELPEGRTRTMPDHEGKEALVRLQRILGHLGPKAREVFEMRYVEELELLDISRRTGASLATTKRHLARIAGRVFSLVEKDAALGEYMSV